MGFLDFLKVTVVDSSSKKPGVRHTGNFLVIDGQSFPLLVLTPKGAVAGGFDGRLVKGQKAQITISVDDTIAQFSFPNTVIVTEAQNGKLAVEFNLLRPELEKLLKQYAERRKKG